RMTSTFAGVTSRAAVAKWTKSSPDSQYHTVHKRHMVTNVPNTRKTRPTSERTVRPCAARDLGRPRRLSHRALTRTNPARPHQKTASCQLKAKVPRIQKN